MISPEEAANSLRDIDRINHRTGVAGAYSHASPHLLLWGAIWAVGYTGCGLTRPDQWGYVWLPLIVVGAVGAMALGMRGRAKTASRSGAGFSPNAAGAILAVALGAFIASTYTLFQPVAPLPYLVFPALLMGLVYAVIGSFGMPRFLVIGACVLAFTMGGYLFAREWTPFWIAAVGGGGLLLGGLWLRQA
jgi:hypothetical protein